MLARLFIRLIDANAVWARPLGDFYIRILRPLLRAVWPLKDFLNGKWLGHSLHAAITDFAIGALLSVTLLDLIGFAQAADALLVLGLLAMLAAAVAGIADYTDTDGLARMRATVHNTVMIVTLIVYAISLVMRLGAPADRTPAIVVALVAALLLTVGAYVGGEVVYAVGNMVNRHAWRRGDEEWVPLDLSTVAESTPTQVVAGGHPLLVVRHGDTVFAMDDICSHAGGILSQGTIVDGQIQCPLHGSRYELSTGYKRRGPTTFDQPWYEVRRTAAGGYEARLAQRK
jgi:nitrite reductase/ring-hydroxylating ferredoxin subunit